MRILLTADPMIPVPPIGYGGIERIVDALARQYRSAGHVVGLLAHPESTTPVDSRYRWPSLRTRGKVAGIRNSLAVLQTAAKFQPHVIHSFSRLGYLLPIIRSGPLKIMSYQRHTGGRQVAWAAKLGGRSLQFTGCSEFICRMGRPAGGRWTAIPNFIELEKFTFQPQVAPDAPLVFLSRLDDIKGPDTAIAIARAAKRRLVLAGNRAESGPQRAFFDREILPHLDGEQIKWIGEVNDDAKNKLLGHAAAMLVPIRWDEPFGIVFAEALACGTPVITTRRGATPEIVDSGRTGYLINSVEDAVAAVAKTSALDRADCRKAAETRFSAVSAAMQYLQLFGRALAQ